MEPIRIEFTDPDAEPLLPTTVLINGHPAETEILTRRDRLGIRVQNPALVKLLGAYSLQYLQSQFESMAFSDDAVESDLFEDIRVLFSVPVATESEQVQHLNFPLPSLWFTLAVDVTEWARPWNLGAYSRALTSATEKRNITGLNFHADLEPFRGIGFRCTGRSQNHTLGEELGYWVETIRSIDEEATVSLIAAQNADSIITTFNFPPQVQGACEQYLTYFAQFLRELGIEATTGLQHEETTVLFSVMPKGKEHALEQVWRALAVYLQLPTSATLEFAATQSTDVRVQQLAGMVQYYNAQLTLSRAAARSAEIDLRAQARDIQTLERESAAQQLVIAEQRTLLQQQARAMESANVLLDSLHSISKGGVVMDKEEFLGGVVALGTMEEKGVSINWAEGWRRLRRWVSG